MKAYEFPGRIAEDGRIEVPESMRSVVQAEQAVRVILLVEEVPSSDEESAWSELSARQFLDGYVPEDSVYDEL